MVMRQNAVISGPISEGEIAQEAIREELARILESSIFIQSNRLGDLEGIFDRHGGLRP